MKCRFIIQFILILFSIQLLAQSPQGLQYQAVIRDGNGNPLLNTNVQFRFTIENNSGVPVYYSEHQSITSNALGGINLIIGKGTATTGSFENINWKSGTIRIRVEMDPTGGQNFLAFGTTD